MNEQLIVKNFGPIKDATVDFKRVTIFIGPTGGGKSTLAKLAAMFSNPSYFETLGENFIKSNFLADYQLENFKKAEALIFAKNNDFKKAIDSETGELIVSLKENHQKTIDYEFINAKKLLNTATSIISKADLEQDLLQKKELLDEALRMINRTTNTGTIRR